MNGRPISSQLLRFLADEHVRARSIPPDKVAEAYRRVLDELIARELLFQHAMARNIKVDDATVAAAFDEARAQYPDDAAWQGFLARRGADVDTFRLDVRARQMVGALLEEEKSRITGVSEGEARAYFAAHPEEFESGERVRLSHIFLHSAQEAGPAARAKDLAEAKALVVRLRRGQDFSALAREASHDRDTAARGGSLPEMGRRNLPPALADAVFALAPGAVSDPIETPQGFEIMRLDARVPSRRYTYDEARSRLVQALLVRKRQEAIQQLVARLRNEARIEISI